MSPRRASLPPPLPPLRARPDSPLRFRSGRNRPACSLPPPAPGGGKITKRKIDCATCSPFPAPSPASRPSGHVPSLSLRDVSVRTARCPLPLPAGAFNHINSYLSTQLLRVRPTLIRTIFFSFARSFTCALA